MEYHLISLAGRLTWHAANLQHHHRGALPNMSNPKNDWVDGIIPPARHWRVVHRYLGMADAVLHPDADSCFAANAICRRVYSRFPITDFAYHYRPLVPHAEPINTADLSGGDHGHGDTPAHGDDHGAGATDAGRTGDSDGGSTTDALRPDDGDTGRAEDVLLADQGAERDAAAEPACAVCNALAGDVLHEERVDG